MSRTIKTYSDLCAERERLKELQLVQKARMREDWDGLKDEFIPMKSAFGTIGKMMKPNKDNPLVNTGLRLATEAIVTRFVLGKAGWAARLAVPFVIRNFSSHLIADKGKSLFGKLEKLFSKKNDSGENLQEPENEEDMLYTGAPYPTNPAHTPTDPAYSNVAGPDPQKTTL